MISLPDSGSARPRELHGREQAVHRLGDGPGGIVMRPQISQDMANVLLTKQDLAGSFMEILWRSVAEVVELRGPSSLVEVDNLLASWYHLSWVAILQKRDNAHTQPA
jgi:hypothetical protein